MYLYPSINLQKLPFFNFPCNMKRYYLFILVLFIPLFLNAQFMMRRQTTIVKAPDSIDISYYAPKKFWGAAAQVFSLNMGIWGIDRYALKADFAYIGTKSIWSNIKEGLYWDNDQIGTNMFLHPYHGSLYYNSARAKGYNYWESGAFALGGSVMWEFFMENEHPSSNDLIATPVGGLALGEVFYRLSDLALDDRDRGMERFKHEFIAFLIAPTRGLTRILNGDAWRVRRTSGRQFGMPMMTIEAAVGMRTLQRNNKIDKKSRGGVMLLNMTYGDRYEVDNSKPYNYFSMRSQINMQAGQPALGQINIIGQLWATELKDTEKDFLSLGVYQHFDYFDSDTLAGTSEKTPYKIAAPAVVGIGLIHKNKRLGAWRFNSSLHANAIILGASLSDYYKVGNRDYNLASGFGVKAGANIAYRDKIGVSWIYEGFRLYTFKGYPEGIDLETVDYNELNAQGDKSNATFNTSSLRVDCKLWDRLYLSALVRGYRRSTHYKYFDDIYSFSGEGQLLLNYKF
ncbi:MAG: hypothetical protein RL662_864 [Bacteroidota bacterium]|jgi:hypothetical protein